MPLGSTGLHTPLELERCFLSRLQRCPQLFRPRAAVELQLKSITCYRRLRSRAGISRYRHYSQASTSFAPGKHDGRPSFTRLNGRSLIAVTGRDAATFLQGLTTNNIPFDVREDTSDELPPHAVYTAFLNAQGRLLQDVMMYEVPQSSTLWESIGVDVDANETTRPGFLVEVDSGQIGNLTKSLRRYKLRAKVSIRQVEAQKATVASIWDNNRSDVTLPALIKALNRDGAHCRRDDRAPGFGFRVIASSEALSRLAEAREAAADEYRLRRYLHSIPEGQTELPYETSLAHESDLDYMRGIDFRKGCYVGQELVIRTQHTGVVRKRILPALIYPASTDPPSALEPTLDSASTFPDIPYGTDIKSVGLEDHSGRKVRSAGKWVANVGNVGLALARLEVMAGLGPTGERLEAWHAPEFALDPLENDVGRLRVKAFVPAWWSERRILKAP